MSVYDSAGRRKYLTINEGVAFIEASKSAKEGRTFCEILYYTGCRISEALALTSRDFDLAEDVVLIKTLKKKGEKSVRRVPIPAQLTAELAQTKQTDLSLKLWSFSRTSGWRKVKGIMEEARIQGNHATPKGLRHAFGVRSALAKVPITTIQRWMGHSSLETTAIYLEVRGVEERELMSRTWNLNHNHHG